MTLAAPIAVTPKNRNRPKAAIFKATPVRIELAKKTAAAISMTAMRPKRSAIGPANQAPNAEPRSAPATAKPSNQDTAPDKILMASTARLMTEVSKPNKKPPIAADAATSAILPTAMRSVDDPCAAGLWRSMDGMGLANQGQTIPVRPNRALVVKLEMSVENDVSLFVPNDVVAAQPT